MRERKPTEPLRLGGHFIKINGELVPINPFHTDLPERCKIAMAELKTGLPHVLVDTGREVNAK